MNRFKRWADRGWRTLAALAVAMLLGPVVPAMAQPEPPIIGERYIPDGEWFAFFVSEDVVSEAGATAAGGLEGSMEFSSRAGGLDGVFEIEGTMGGEGAATLAGPDVSGEVVYYSQGFVEGAADRPQLVISSVTLSGTIVVQGQTVPLDYTTEVPPGSGIEVEITHATCSMAIGRWDTIGEAGIGHFTGQLVATRVGDLRVAPVDYREEVATLLTDIAEFQASMAETGAIDFAVLNDLLTRAENLSHSLVRSAECGLTDEAPFILPITEAVADMIRTALENPEALSNADLRRLIYAGLRAGAIGMQGAMSDAEYSRAYPEAYELEQGLGDLLDARLTQAIAEGDYVEIVEIGAAAASVGADEVAGRAFAEADAIGEGGGG